MTIYYAATNSYASTTSVGFANTWNVLGFHSKAARDAFVESRDDMATRAITKREVTRYASNYVLSRNEYNKPTPFSGQFWGLVSVYWQAEPDGYAGHVMVCDPDDTADRVFG